MFGRMINLENHNILLGTRPKSLQSQNLYLFCILRITALKQITRGWKSQEPPRVDRWLEKMEDMYLMEKVTYKINGKDKLFEKRWASYLSKKDNLPT